MQLNFDLDEFIAYLLYGALLLAGISSTFGLDLSKVYPSGTVTGSVADTATKLLILGGLTFVAGHVCSIFSRHVTRQLLWVSTTRPRELIFLEAPSQFWDEITRHKFLSKVQSQFFAREELPTNDDLKRTVPRIVRSYVMANCEAFSEVRNRIVRARSMCANAVLPLLLFAYSNYQAGEAEWAISFGFAAALMLVKQHDLDVREWKEVYTFFLAIEINTNLAKEPAELPKDVPQPVKE